MSVSNSSIKTIAKGVLRDNYISSFVLTVALFTIMFITYNISAVISLVVSPLITMVFFLGLCLFFITPLFVGAIRYFWHLSCGINDNPIILFNYFSSRKAYFKVIKFALLLSIKVGISYLVFSIPVFVAKLIAGSWIYSVLDVSTPIWTLNINEVIIFLRVIAVMATLVASFKYYLAPMLFVADENMDISEVLHLSTVISKKTLFDYILFIFSFTGWFLLSIFIIPLVYIFPYVVLSYLVYSAYAVNDFNEEIAKINLDDIPTYVAGV